MRFTIRDAVWLLIVAAMAIAWWTDHALMADRVEAHRAGMRDLERQLKHLTEMP